MTSENTIIGFAPRIGERVQVYPQHGTWARGVLSWMNVEAALNQEEFDECIAAMILVRKELWG